MASRSCRSFAHSSIPGPPSVGGGGAAAAAAAGALDLPHHRSTPRQKSPLQFPLPPIAKWSSLALKCLRGKEAMKPPSCEIKKEGILNRSVGIFPRFVVRFY